MSKVKAGDEFTTNEGGRVVVVEYVNAKNVLVKHMDDYGHEMVVQSQSLREGGIRNPYHPSVYGFGFIGVGDYISKEGGKITKAYVTWNGMFTRCYSPKCQERQPTYIGCSVDERWHNFQVFAKWMNEQHREDDWQLDKDLISNGNKVYSPETCRFIPRALNTLLNDHGGARGDLPQGVTRQGDRFKARLRVNGEKLYLGTHPTAEQAFQVYKKAKEENIKRMAEIHKDVICPLVYEALIVYDVKQ